MSELAWASDMLRTEIAPPGSAENKAQRIIRAAFALRWSPSRTKDVWYRDPRVAIRPKELRKIEQITGVTYGRQELRSVEDLVSRADALLEGSDADFHGPFVAALRAFVGALDRS